MTFGQGPTTNRRRLRLSLRKLREDRGLTLEDVRKRMEWSLSKILRIETGAVGISVNDLKVLLSFYEVSDPVTVEQLLDLARQSRQRHWASEYREVVSPAYMDFLGYEDDACRITQFHPLVVPGLLQTEEYARAVVVATTLTPVNDSVIEARVRLRLARQRRLFGTLRHRRVRFLIDDDVLHKSLWDQAVIYSQLSRLIDLCDHPEIDMGIVRKGAKVPARLTGPFSLHEFESNLDPDVVYLDNMPNDVALVDDKHVIDRYKRAIVDLFQHADTGDDARDRLREIRNSFRPSENRSTEGVA
ncbi:helix-turn-helix transcriptional regulator [Micromonospora sp. NPDC049171]|uniref:helix-turn-helix domain-containing protein n=1 Tax=Micromonospora sp. NPDC049171 TaxID=3155770 RepID=UPI0033E91B90